MTETRQSEDWGIQGSRIHLADRWTALHGKLPVLDKSSRQMIARSPTDVNDTEPRLPITHRNHGE